MRALFSSVLILLICSLAHNANAQNKIQIDVVSVGHQRRSVSSEEFFTIQLKNISDLQRLKHYHFLGNNWISMRWKDMESQSLLSSNMIEMYGKLKPALKMSNLFELEFNMEKKLASHENISINIHTWGTKDKANALLKQYDITEVEWDHSGRFCTVIANKHQIEKIIESDFISFIEPVSEERTPLQITANGLMNVEQVHREEPVGLNLQGEGISIGVWDYGLTGFHRDLEGQFTNVEKDFYNAGGTQHTTLVTGAIAAKGILRERSIGVAPKAKAYVYNYFGKVLDEIVQAKNNFNVYTTNHSYNIGSTFRCFTDYSYSTASVQIDQFAIDEPQIVNLFAAGNSAAACAFDFKTIVPGFQYAKNVILVGNLQNNETFYPGSAKGPTNDGRLRPDVMAKGSGSFTPTTGIVLPSPTDTYANAYGTSFATPIVSGIVGLMQEAYKKKYNQLPLNTTVKAILCNTAKDLGNPGPDYEYGFGKADAYLAIKAIQDGKFIEGSVGHQEEKVYDINVAEGTRELKVFITWNDVPAALPNDKVLVNDLDLQVVAPDGRVFYPLILKPSVPGLTAFEGRDSLNNSEQIVIKLPLVGNYSLKVKGYNIIEGGQSFSISYWTNENEFAWNYPLENSVLTSGVANLIRWNTNTLSDSVKIEYSLDAGNSWESAGNQISNTNFLSWTVPAGFQSKVLLRALTMDDRVLSVSDTFVLCPAVTISSNRVCYDHIRIVWNSIAGTSKYIVSMLDKKNEWIDVAETTQNNYTYSKTTEGKEYFFAVRPVFDEFTGIRSHALKVTARNNITCLFTYKDIAVSSISPEMGAVSSEYALSANEKLVLKVVNYANSVVNNAKLYYQVDMNPVHEITLGNLAANAVTDHTTAEEYDFSLVGEYTVRAWVTSDNDVNPANDTLVHIITQKQSVIATFPYFQDFEGTGDTLLYTKNFISLKEMPEWDFIGKGASRISNFTSSSFSPNGARALTVDAHTDNVDAANTLYLNIDLSTQKDSLVYMDYLQISRGEVSAGDTIYIQGNRSELWIPAHSLFNLQYPAGITQPIKRINLSKLMQDNGQEFSEHTVIKFTVNTSRTAQTMSIAGGYTLDDIRIYNGGSDLGLKKIELSEVYCIHQNTLPIQIPVKILITNNSPNVIPAGQVELYLKVNDTIKLLEHNTRDFQPYEEVLYEFSGMLSFDDFENYRISAGISYAQDNIPENNEILNQSVNFLKAIKSLPLETGFDHPDELSFVPAGNFYSWELGKPSKVYLYNVADNPGNAWVTDLKNFYPPNENSYLYIGCFDPAMLTFNSELSFLMLYNLEYGSDGLWIEYSYDGSTWFRLGTSSTGYNWYNPAHSYNFWDDNRLNWQTASFPLTGFVNASDPSLFFRYAFSTGDYIQLEGVAIDNFRINNQLNARVNTQNTSMQGISTGAGIVELKSNNVIYGYLDDKGQVLGNIQIDIMIDQDQMPAYRDKFLLQRFYHIKTENTPAVAYGLTLFNQNSEYINYLNTDKNIRRMGEIGYLVYDGINTDTLFSNNHFSDNYTFYHPDSIEFWPYLEGYELRFSLDKQQAEIYLTSNQTNKNAYPFVAITDLDVYRTEESNHTFVAWTIEKESGVENYVVQYSVDGKDFVSIDTVAAHTDGSKNYLYADSLHIISGEHFYRLIALKQDSQYVSLIDSIAFEFVSVKVPIAQAEKGQFQVSYMGNGHLYLYWNTNDEKNYRLRIVDVAGKIIEEWKDYLHSGYQDIHSAVLQKSPAGMYFLQILDGNDSKSRKFVKSE